MALNLVQHRGAENVWDRAEVREWDPERWLLAAVAGGLLVSGLRARSFTGLALTLSGSVLAWLAAGGIDERTQWHGQLRSALPHRPRHMDTILEASEESFPASDAPSWTPTTGSSRTDLKSRWH